jgi:hypothetical protein
VRAAQNTNTDGFVDRELCGTFEKSAHFVAAAFHDLGKHMYAFAPEKPMRLVSRIFTKPFLLSVLKLQQTSLITPSLSQ